MSKLEKYSSYKDSGVEWIGKIPEHWIISKLGISLKPISIKDRADLPLLSVTREKGVIQRDIEDQESNHNFIPDDLSGYKMVKQGQFAMNKMKAWQGSYGVSNFTGIVSPAYYIFKLNGIEPAFFHITVRSKIYVPFFIQASDGVRIGQWDLSKNRMKEIPFYIPPKQEQIKIASFLDTKTEQLDKAIQQKEQLIELLKERRQILINDAVTKGIDKTVAMKDSGVEWIGEIPEGWEVKKLKYLLKINNGQDYKHIVSDKGYPVIGSGGEFAKASQYLHDGEVLLLGRKGTIDKPLYFIGKFWTVDTMFYSVVKNNNLTKFLYYSSLSIPFNYYSTSTALPSMTQFDLNNHQIPMPLAKKEQRLIVSHIEENNKKINKTIDLQQQQITKLKEYKTTLIDSVVTGKVRVV